jgi:hypothetical protein
MGPCATPVRKSAPFPERRTAPEQPWPDWRASHQWWVKGGGHGGPDPTLSVWGVDSSCHSLSAFRPAAVIIMYVTSTVLLLTVRGALYRIASLDFRRLVSKRLVKPWSSMIASEAKSLASISSARRALALRRCFRGGKTFLRGIYG